MARDYAKYRTRGRKRGTNGIPGIIWLFIGVLLGLIMAGVIYIKGLHNRANQGLSPYYPSTPHVTHVHPLKHTREEHGPTAPRFDFYTILPKMKVWVPANQGHNKTVEAKRDIIIPAPDLNKAHEGISDDTVKATRPKHLVKRGQDDERATTDQDDETSRPIAKKEPVEATQGSRAMIDKDEITPRHIAKEVQDEATPRHVASKNQEGSNYRENKSKHVASKGATAKKQRYLVQTAVDNASTADQLKAQLLLSGFDVHVKTTAQGRARLYLGPYNSMQQAQTAKSRLAELHIKGAVLKQEG